MSYTMMSGGLYEKNHGAKLHFNDTTIIEIEMSD